MSKGKLIIAIILNCLYNVINKSIQRTPLSDENSCSLLIYSNKYGIKYSLKKNSYNKCNISS